MSDDLKQSLRQWLLETASGELEQFDKWASEAFPGESLDFQPDTMEKLEPGGWINVIRVLRLGLIVEERKIATDDALMRRLRGFHNSSRILMGLMAGESWRRGAISHNARRAAGKRHKENREIAEAIKHWWRENRKNFTSLDAAAEAALAVAPISFRTARGHIGEAAKELRSASKA